jgi:hypothetical protein
MEPMLTKKLTIAIKSADYVLIKFLIAKHA